jgi:MFS family permease
MLLASLPVGLLSDHIGRKRALLLSNTGRMLALLGLAFVPGAVGLLINSVVLGGAKTLLHVSRLPFMMENSDDHDRTALFSAVTALWGQAGLIHAGAPLYSAFTMERVKPQQRGTVSSLRNMAWTFGRAAGQPLSGLVQVRWGFGPLFAASTALYLASAGLIWTFFSQKEKSP